MGAVWQAIPDRSDPIGDGQASGGILVDALLFWLLTGALLGTCGMMLYYTNGAAP